jgi:hypothetical protein
MAGYRNAYEARGRAWLTLDGVEVASFCQFEFENAWRDEGRREVPTGRPFTTAAYEKVRSAGLRDKSDFLDALGACLGSTIDQILQSPDPLIRALAMLDRRLGKRRLARLDVSREHPLVQRTYCLRCQAESVRPPP